MTTEPTLLAWALVLALVQILLPASRCCARWRGWCRWPAWC